jgi:hypothetical protein
MRHDLYRFSGNHVPRAAVYLSRDPGLGTHAGIIYPDENSQLACLDFYLNGAIASRQWKGKWPHVIPNADDDALDNLSSLCRVIAARYRGRTPEHLFGFRRDPRAAINPTTGQLDLGGAAGASCASFVIIVLSNAGIQLVTHGPDWPHRPPVDDARHAQLLQHLSPPRYTPEDLARIQAELPCPRVAPEEVVGACLFPNLPDMPADQAFAERAARWIMGLFDYNASHGC